jgi:hypothetical protein
MEEGGKLLKQSKSPLHNAVVVERGFRGEVKKQCVSFKSNLLTHNSTVAINTHLAVL